ncbi:TPA: hypothetical protein QCX08_002517, partial [Bacillus cytotoxicus]|nr:hypothetical protein [Bacillus cytotoxicus]
MNNNIAKEELGMIKNRKKKTQGSENFLPENQEEQKRSFPEDELMFVKPKKKLTTKDLPKSIRISIETHAAISALATLQGLNIYEVVNQMVEEKVASLPPAQQKLVKNTVKQVIE